MEKSALILIAFFIPPLSVYFAKGIGRSFYLNLIIYLLSSILYVIYIFNYELLENDDYSFLIILSMFLSGIPPTIHSIDCVLSKEDYINNNYTQINSNEKIDSIENDKNENNEGISNAENNENENDAKINIEIDQNEKKKKEKKN